MSTNPQSKPINQKRGPTTGNAGSMSKRDTYVAEKAASSGQKSKLAMMVTDALEMRGERNKPTIKESLENLKGNFGPDVNPTANGSKLSSKYKMPRK